MAGQLEAESNARSELNALSYVRICANRFLGHPATKTEILLTKSGDEFLF
jgi:hypothetical protein